MFRKTAALSGLMVLTFLSGHLRAGSEGLPELYQLYGDLLSEYTERGRLDGLPLTVVDYDSLSGDERWSQLIEKMESLPVTTLDTENRRKAFYLNAYNILAINKVLDHWPLRSLRSVGTVMNPVWIHDAGVVAGQPVTLEYLEHKVLRKMGDPRVHMAINCASISCPDLRREPYAAEQVDQQLDDQAHRLLHQQGKGVEIDPENQTIRLSVVFDWFEEDFKDAGGVEAYVRRYRQDLPVGWSFDPDLPYNWGINGELTARTLRAMREDF